MKFDESALSGAARRQPQPSPMDVRRTPQPKRGRYAIAAISLIVLVLVAVALTSLKPALPVVDRATLIIDSVRRGDMVRDVRGPGTLVPEQVRWISAVTSARVERIVAQPGQVVEPNTVLLEMSNPDVQIQALQAEQALSEAETRFGDLKVQLEGSRLSQEGTVAAVKTVNVSAAQERIAADTLLADRLISRFEYNNRRAAAEESSTRLKLEQKRLELMTQSVSTQLAAQQRQIERLRSIAAFQANRVQSLVVRAGEHGVLQELSLQPGQWVNGGSSLAKVVQPGKLKAVLRIGEVQAKDLALGQPASIDTRNGIVAGHVSRMDPGAQAGTVTVDVALDGELPSGARPDLNVDGTIQLERLKNVLNTGRPTLAESNGRVGIYRLDAGGKSATRVSVRLGRVSANSVEIIQGLKEGDRLILSDLSLPDNTDHIRIK